MKCSPPANVIPLLTTEAQIKRAVREHLKRLGFSRDTNGLLRPADDSKATFRSLHAVQRANKLRQEREFIKAHWHILKKHFANGEEINPALISPRLQLVSAGTEQSDLFRIACLLWSVPVSAGYGRRMRFLVWDSQNDKLIGLVALGDPVFNLRVRDEWVAWTAADRSKRLVNVLDAYVLGAVPPYNRLLGTKLVATLAISTEVKDAFHSRYAARQGIISKELKHASLCLITTTSALGRSSVYNRLSLDGRRVFTSLGFTSGWGHFHISDRLFAKLRVYLKSADDDYHKNNRFGNGPNWRLRATRRAFELIGLDPSLLQHGIRREFFVAPLATNAREVLRGESDIPDFSQLKSVADLSDLALKRWIVPRSQRCPDFRNWSVNNLEKLLKPSNQQTAVSTPISNRTYNGTR